MASHAPMEEIYRQYAKPVKYYVLSLCKNEDVAEDITAEAFLKAVQHIDSFRGGNVLTWLCTIAKRTYFDFAKKKERGNLPLGEELAQTLTATDHLPERGLLESDARVSLYKALQLLTPEAREVVYLRMFTELSFQEIGEILSKSENWARVMFYRSKLKLKGWMDDEA